MESPGPREETAVHSFRCFDLKALACPCRVFHYPRPGPAERDGIYRQLPRQPVCL